VIYFLLPILNSVGVANIFLFESGFTDLILNSFVLIRHCYTHLLVNRLSLLEFSDSLLQYVWHVHWKYSYKLIYRVSLSTKHIDCLARWYFLISLRLSYLLKTGQIVFKSLVPNSSFRTNFYLNKEPCFVGQNATITRIRVRFKTHCMVIHQLLDTPACCRLCLLGFLLRQLKLLS